VHVGTQSGNYSQTFDVGSATSFSFPNATAGQRYYFAVASYFPGPVVGPLSQEVSGSTNGAPVLTNPGSQIGTVGSPVTLQLKGSDPQGQPVSYGASSLPPGLSIAAATGFISGTPSAAGTYLVTASVTDGVLSDAETFSWTISQAGSTGGTAPAPGDISPSPGDSLAPTLRITLPTTSDSYISNQTLVTIGGTASDNVGIVRVEWSTSAGASGMASGTDSWIAGVAIGSGSTTITVRAFDHAGNMASDAIVVKTRGNTARPGTGNGKKTNQQAWNSN
jgi:hypothetical protein